MVEFGVFWAPRFSVQRSQNPLRQVFGTSGLKIGAPQKRQIRPRPIQAPHSWPSEYILSAPILRDTARLSQRYPPIARYGVFGVSTWPIGCDTPSPFSERFPLGEHAKWRCDTPPQKGYLSDTCAIPFENKAKCMRYPPLRYYLERVMCAIWGGISHWGAQNIFLHFLGEIIILQRCGSRKPSEDCSRASTRKICPKQGPRKSHEKVTKKARTLFF